MYHQTRVGACSARRPTTNSSTKPGQAQRAPFANGHAPFVNGRAPFANGHAPFVNGRAPFTNLPAPFAEHATPFASGRAPLMNNRAPIANLPAPFTKGAAPFANRRSVRGVPRPPTLPSAVRLAPDSSAFHPTASRLAAAPGGVRILRLTCIAAS